MTSKIFYLQKKAKEVRRLLLTMAYRGHAGHIGSALSSADLLSALYFQILKINPKKPLWNKRDIFIMSKGHGCFSYYAALAVRGFLPLRALSKIFADGTKIAAHPTRGTMPGIEFSTGSLGHGLSAGAGMAYGFIREGRDSRVVVMLSDGECDEGSVWEAALSASHLRLHNLIVVIDYNKKQAFGNVSDVLALEPFRDKWHSFGWNVMEIDGHDFIQIEKAFKKAYVEKKHPTAIIAHTVKGKGVDFMEDTIEWHYLNLDKEKFDYAMRHLA